MAGVTSVVIDGTTYMVDDINAVDFSEDQGLTEQQQQQGRSNIGAATETSLAGLEGTVGELSDDVDELTEAIVDKASAIVDTASGAIASFMDGAAVPAKDVTIAIEPVQSGSGDPSPTNVRPISGWTGANVTRTGKNLTNMPFNGYYDGDTGAFVSDSSWKASRIVRVEPNSAYTLTKPASVAAGRCEYDSFMNLIGYSSFSSALEINHFTTKANAQYLGFYGREGAYQLELGSTATPYEPYVGTTIPISWQSEAGTVYGGTLDVTTGLLTVTHGNIASYNGESLPGKWVSSMDVYSAGGTPTTGAQVVYELAAPQTYQLTPTEVKLLLGENNVWADTGDSTVTYRADTKLYIQKINAPTDDDMTADAQIASGKYFIVGGNLYRSTTTIPAGDTINPGTNCILTNLADALNALNT